MKDLALFIDSFDGNSDVWPVFFNIFDHYWKGCSFKRYLISNSRGYTTSNLEVIKTGEDSSWFPMSIKGLESIPEKYVLFLLEDYGISKAVDDSILLNIIERMDAENIYYYRLTCPGRFPVSKDFIKVPEATHYPISLQPAIWNREKFLSILKQLYSEGAKTPWDFEKYFINKYKNGSEEKIIEGIRYDSRDLLGYQNLIIQGKWDPRVIRIYRRRRIKINTGKRGTMQSKAVILDGLKRNKFVRSISYKNQERIKRVLKKLGVHFMT